ncbi:NACHT domain-containing protein [Aliarcobacter butzleri]|uniref:NACHT domain-containing protein n=1 Tax=Aliarcobacter butzleri TaxID=28197 RepID=UPI0021B31B70|nr:NACHT domain-containing protein [Aliarcobacter butzleri]MCT7609959.1 NACHT domain-containing protein [Aliarcobacter butzleri]
MLQINKYSRFKYTPDEMSEDEFLKRFVIRLEIFQEIFDDIKSSDYSIPNQHYIIIGQRGQGKTSLLRKIEIEVKNDDKLSTFLLPIKFAEEQYQIRSLSRFWEEIADYLQSLYSEIFPTILDDMEEHFEDDDYELKAFSYLENVIKKSNKKLLLLIDNIDELIAKLSEKEQRQLREVLLSSSSFRIIGGSTKMLEQHYDYSKPFYEFFKIIKLRGFDKKESKKFLLSLAQEDEYKQKIEEIIENNPERIEVIRQLTGGVPRTLVILFDIFLDDSGDAFDDLLRILDEVTPLYKHRMDDLPTQLQEIVHTLAINWDGMLTNEIAKKTRIESKAVSAQLKKLEKYEIIESESIGKNNIYKIKERFFNIWYLMRFGRKKDRQRVAWLINFLTSWCTREELETKAVEFKDKIKNGAVKPLHAFYMSEALRYTDLSLETDLELKKELENYLKNVGSSFCNQLSESDNELLIKSVDLEKKNKIEEAINLLINSKRGSENILFYLHILYEKIGNYENSEKYIQKIFNWTDEEFKNKILSFYIFNNKYNVRVKELLIERHNIQNENYVFFIFIIRLVESKKFHESYERAIELLNLEVNEELQQMYITWYITFILTKKQYYLAKKLLELEEYNLKEKLKPTWYALMTYMQDEYPNEIKKMGSELQESVNEIIRNIEELKMNK